MILGAVSFSLDRRLLDALSRDAKFDIFVETGSFHGDTIAQFKDRFDRFFTIELSDELHRGVVERFRDDERVRSLNGDSAQVLGMLRPEIEGFGTLYWLDAHWCEADSTSGQQSQCPLLRELTAIGTLNNSSVVLIDDARLFLAPPVAPHEASQWPGFNDVVNALQSLSRSHRLMVVNDVIAFYPPEVEDALKEYARDFGVDWLRAAQTLEENLVLRSDLEAKERVIETLREERDTSSVLDSRTIFEELAAKEKLIQQQARTIKGLESQSIDKLHQEIGEKERLIQQQARTIESLKGGSLDQRLRSFTRRGRQTVKTCIRHLFRVRLGILSQHPPCPIRLPDHYTVPVALSAVPTISIVTPSFNQGDYLQRTLDSILDQKYPAIEIFVQDGGSKDTSVELLRVYEDRLSGWISEPDEGQSDAIDKGFARTSGEIMAWLNSDDLLLPGSLHKVAQFFNDHPDVDVVYGHRLLIDCDDQMIGRWIMPPHRDDILSWADYVPQETLFWRREIWERAGGRIDRSFRFAMDWDLLMRFRDVGARFACLPQFLGAFRVHEQQKTSAIISEVGYAEMDRLRERALGRVPQPAEVYKAVAPYLMRHVVSDFGWRLRNRLRGRR